MRPTSLRLPGSWLGDLHGLLPQLLWDIRIAAIARNMSDRRLIRFAMASGAARVSAGHLNVELWPGLLRPERCDVTVNVDLKGMTVQLEQARQNLERCYGLQHGADASLLRAFVGLGRVTLREKLDMTALSRAQHHLGDPDLSITRSVDGITIKSSSRSLAVSQKYAAENAISNDLGGVTVLIETPGH